MNVALLAPRYCWHTEGLVKVSLLADYRYTLIYDTAPFLSRESYQSIHISKYVSYEFVQRIWRLLLLPFWAFHVSRKLRIFPIVHCHGLFSLVLATLSFYPLNRIVFTPQGSDLLLLPLKYGIVRFFLRIVLPHLASVAADSQLLLDSCSRFSSINPSRLIVIQNGIDQKLLNHVRRSTHSLKYDLCWPRGLSPVYNLPYFFEILAHLDHLVSTPVTLCVIGAYGTNNSLSRLNTFANISVTFTPRLTPSAFFRTIAESRVILSIPLSDSSPRTVYEALYLRKPLFLTRLPCFNWLPSITELPITFSTNDPLGDARLLLELLSIQSSNITLPYTFTQSLDYNFIAKQYSQLFQSCTSL